MTANFFDVLGVKPLLGRTFTDQEDETNPNLVLISYSLWQRRYAGDPGVVNRSMPMDGVKHTILGVMPANFVFRDREIAFWRPIHLPPARKADRGSHYLNLVARLKPGVSIGQAREEMAALTSRIRQQFPDQDRLGVVLVPLREELLGKTRLAVLVLMGAAGCVLLIAAPTWRACSRPGGGPTAGNGGPRGPRAGRGRLIRQMVTEGMLLSLIGGALGLAIARAAMVFLAKLAPMGFAVTEQPHSTPACSGSPCCWLCSPAFCSASFRRSRPPAPRSTTRCGRAAGAESAAAAPRPVTLSWCWKSRRRWSSWSAPA